MQPQQFEELHGTNEFLKVCIESINAILIDKGICTEKELKDKFEFFSALKTTQKISKQINNKW